MRLVELGLGEIGVVRGNDRQVHCIGDLEMPALAGLLGRWQAALDGVALQFDIKPLGENRSQIAHQRLIQHPATR